MNKQYYKTLKIKQQIIIKVFSPDFRGDADRQRGKKNKTDKKVKEHSYTLLNYAQLRVGNCKFEKLSSALVSV